MSLGLLLSLNKSGGGGRFNPQMVQSTFGKDRKRLLDLDPPGLLADGPGSNVGRAGGAGHGPGWGEASMKTQLSPCTPSPAICGWYLPGLLPSCLGSVGDAH